MQFIYYKDRHGNFGDDLNAWIWPKIFCFDRQRNVNSLFYGIGTILSKDTKLVDLNPKVSKIVFGTGVRPSTDPIKLDKSWKIKFVRGPLSAMTFGDNIEYITDAAYAIRQLDSLKNLIDSPKKYEISIMPHMSSANKLNWKNICQKLRINYISPHSEKGVEHTMREIAASRYLISEAMHGAIVADAMRVPWKRFILFSQEQAVVSEFKWMDWMFSLKMQPAQSISIRIFRRSFIHKFLRDISLGMIHAKFYLKNRTRDELIHAITDLEPADFQLSSDPVLNEIDNRIKQKITEIKNELL
jgi:succinoglycan biosynthesis protein ExoV